jgi:hypothetical protein
VRLGLVLLLEEVRPGSNHSNVRRLLCDIEGLQGKGLAFGDGHRAGLAVALRKPLENLLDAGPWCSPSLMFASCILPSVKCTNVQCMQDAV